MVKGFGKIFNQSKKFPNKETTPQLNVNTMMISITRLNL